jgi:hypothetical protein
MFCAGLFASLKNNLNSNNSSGNNTASSNQNKVNPQPAVTLSHNNNKSTDKSERVDLATKHTYKENDAPSFKPPVRYNTIVANIPEEEEKDEEEEEAYLPSSKNSSEDTSEERMAAAGVAAAVPVKTPSASSALAAFTTSARPIMNKLMCKCGLDLLDNSSPSKKK